MGEIGSWMALVEELKGIREELKGIRELIGNQSFECHERVNGVEEHCADCAYIDKDSYDLPCRNCCMAHNTAISFYKRKE